MRSFLPSFTLTLAALVAAVLAAPLPLPQPFTGRPDPVAAALDRLAAPDLMAVKLAHAATREAYAVGLFGNSRAIPVSCADVGRCGDFFNIAVPGTSIRDWTMMIERLDAMDRLPATVIVSLDNFALEYQSAPTFPAPAARIAALASDLRLAPSAGALPGLLWRFAYSEWSIFTGAFSFERLRQRLGFGSAPDEPWRYRGDGSRADSAAASAGSDIAALGRLNMTVLERDIRALAALKARGRMAHLTVYESPLHPAATGGSARAEALRARFLALCRTLGIDCRPAPRLDAEGWPDASHAPGRLLGRWIAQNLLAGEVR